MLSVKKWNKIDTIYTLLQGQIKKNIWLDNNLVNVFVTWCVEKYVFANVKTIRARLMIGITIPSVFTPVSKFADHRIFFQVISDNFEPIFTSCSQLKFKIVQFYKFVFAILSHSLSAR